MGSFVAASIYLCFTLLYERRMRTAKEGVEEEGKEKEVTVLERKCESGDSETEKKETYDDKEELGVGTSDKTSSSAQEVGGVPVEGGEDSRGT